LGGYELVVLGDISVKDLLLPFRYLACLKKVVLDQGLYWPSYCANFSQFEWFSINYYVFLHTAAHSVPDFFIANLTFGFFLLTILVLD